MKVFRMFCFSVVGLSFALSILSAEAEDRTSLFLKSDYPFSDLSKFFAVSSPETTLLAKEKWPSASVSDYALLALLAAHGTTEKDVILVEKIAEKRGGDQETMNALLAFALPIRARLGDKEALEKILAIPDGPGGLLLGLTQTPEAISRAIVLVEYGKNVSSQFRIELLRMLLHQRDEQAKMLLSNRQFLEETLPKIKDMDKRSTRDWLAQECGVQIVFLGPSENSPVQAEFLPPQGQGLR